MDFKRFLGIENFEGQLEDSVDWAALADLLEEKINYL